MNVFNETGNHWSSQCLPCMCHLGCECSSRTVFISFNSELCTIHMSSCMLKAEFKPVSYSTNHSYSCASFDWEHDRASEKSRALQLHSMCPLLVSEAMLPLPTYLCFFRKVQLNEALHSRPVWTSLHFITKCGQPNYLGVNSILKVQYIIKPSDTDC